METDTRDLPTAPATSTELEGRLALSAMETAGLTGLVQFCKAADFVRAHRDSYDPEMEIYLRERAAEFGTPRG